jgi:CRISP-associated protein Cas1
MQVAALKARESTETIRNSFATPNATRQTDRRNASRRSQQPQTTLRDAPGPKRAPPRSSPHLARNPAPGSATNQRQPREQPTVPGLAVGGDVMTTLHVTQPGSVLHLNAGRLQIHKRGQMLHDTPGEHIEEVMLYSGTQATTQAMRYLLTQETSLHLVTQNGAYIGRLEPGSGGQTELLKAQVRLTDDPTSTLETARAIVQGKLENARTVLARQARSQQTKNNQAQATQPSSQPSGQASSQPYPATQTALEAHQHALEQTAQASTLDELRGLEGYSARTYFAAMTEVIPSQWDFTGRNRRPPKDPVNAMLSFGYTLVLSKILTATQRTGLHPSIGFLHVSHGKRPALALDILEEFRTSLVDRLVLAIISRGTLQPEDFERFDEGCRMNRDARGSFLKILEERLSEPITCPDGVSRPYRETIQHQVRMMARYVRGDESQYQPLKIR